MNIKVLSAEFEYVNGILTFSYFRVEISIGYTPQNIGGEVQLTETDGVSANSTEEEVIKAAKDFVIKTASTDAPKYPGLD